MVHVIFTLDYEIHGNGDGSPHDLMVEPTERLLRLFDEYGAKLTIMADVAEILKFKEYRDQYGRDDYRYCAIVDQLLGAIKGGHDVQLHLHSSYFNARHDGRGWAQDWSEYNFAGLPYERMDWMVRTCKGFLESLLRPADLSYRCIAFRAPNWSVSPSRNVVRTLIKNDIKIDTSVFKFGRRAGIVSFDYSSAHHSLLPWPANPDDICRYDGASPLWEFPIYSENRWVGVFATPGRLYRTLLGRSHKVSSDFSAAQAPRLDVKNNRRTLPGILQKQAWKADFNQCSARQLMHALLRSEKQVEGMEDAPFVLIGHSKLFTRWNEFRLRPFLAFVREHHPRFSFGTFRNVYNQVAPDEDHVYAKALPTSVS
jgi:hypothetical protein